MKNKAYSLIGLLVAMSAMGGIFAIIAKILLSFLLTQHGIHLN